jgi:site-specific DNA-methyltransferase (adenine-specific)
VKPYYEDGSVTIFHGDCRDFLPLADTIAGTLVTDPPYGVELGTGDRRRGSGRLFREGYASYDDTYENYRAIVVPVLTTLVTVSKRAAIWTGPHYHELPKADAIGGIYCPIGTGRNPWGFKTFLPVLLYGTRPNAQAGCYPTAIYSTAARAQNGHPAAKPLEWLRWLVQLVSLPGETLFDPFAGSGTTLRAAKDLGRRAIGIEVEERYCEEAALLCAQEVLAA